MRRGSSRPQHEQTAVGSSFMDIDRFNQLLNSGHAREPLRSRVSRATRKRIGRRVSIVRPPVHLATGHDIDAGPFLKLDRLPDCRVFDRLELRLCQLAGLQPFSCIDQIRWSQQAADDLSCPGGGLLRCL